MTLYQKHVFVCVSGKTCPTQGSEEIFTALKQTVSEKGLKQSIRINKAGCLAQCGHGPMVVVYPQGNWYAGVVQSDCQELLESDLIADKTVDRLLYHPDPTV